MKVVQQGSTETLNWDFKLEKFSLYLLYVPKYKNPFKNITAIKSSGRTKLIIFKNIEISFLQIKWSGISIVKKEKFLIKKFRVEGIQDRAQPNLSPTYLSVRFFSKSLSRLSLFHLSLKKEGFNLSKKYFKPHTRINKVSMKTLKIYQINKINLNIKPWKK